MHPTLLSMFMLAEALYGIPKGLERAVCAVESGLRPNAVHKSDGKTDSLGICQIQEPTAKMLGFTGTREELMSPWVNSLYAGKYLRYQLDRYKGDIRKAISAYNMGSFREKADGTTYNRVYVSKVFKVWAEEL